MAEITTEDVLDFLGSAFRNIELPPIDREGAEDIRIALQAFGDRHVARTVTTESIAPDETGHHAPPFRFRQSRAMWLDHGLSARAAKALAHMRISSIEQLAALSEAEVLREPNCGRTSVKQMRELLARHGLVFSPASRDTRYVDIESLIAEGARQRVALPGPDAACVVFVTPAEQIPPDKRSAI